MFFHFYKCITVKGRFAREVTIGIVTLGMVPVLYVHVYPLASPEEMKLSIFSKRLRTDYRYTETRLKDACASNRISISR